jgi:hypothetical protein
MLPLNQSADTEEQWLMPCPSPSNGLYLREAAIHKQFRSRDVTAVFGGKEHNRLGDIVGCSGPAEWNDSEAPFKRCSAPPRAAMSSLRSGRIGEVWAHDVHANVTVFQIHRPSASE